MQLTKNSSCLYRCPWQLGARQRLSRTVRHCCRVCLIYLLTALASGEKPHEALRVMVWLALCSSDEKPVKAL